MKKLLAIALAVLMAFCCFGTFAEVETDDMHPCHGIGMSIAGFSTQDLYGNPVDSSILDDVEITLINYWATWCPPCVSEMPDLQEAHEHYSTHPEEGVQILAAVSFTNGCTPGSALAFLEQHGYTYTNLAPDSILSAVFNTSGYIPQTIIVDSSGNVIDHIVGAFGSVNDIYEVVNMWKEVLHSDEQCNISFVNGITGEVFATTQVPMGFCLDNLEYPEPPEVEGGTFSNWTYSGDIYETAYSPSTYLAMGDVTVTANYDLQRLKVRFYDGVTGNLISVKMVPYGQAAVPPVHPTHEGYVFIDWDTDFSHVTEPLDVHGVCYRLGDANGDDNIDLNDAAIATRMMLSLMESNPAADYNQDGVVNAVDVAFIVRIALNLL